MSAPARPARRAIPVDLLFAPYVLVLALGAPVLALYLLVPADTFEREFLSFKWDTGTAALYYAAALAAFALGGGAGDVMARRPAAETPAPSAVERDLVRRLCAVALVLTILAYALWWARGIANAGGVTELLNAFARDPNFVKFDVLTTIPGVTTLMQLAVAAVPLAVAYRLLDRRLLVALVAVVAALALGRAILASERLALLELVVPAGYLLVAGRRVSPSRLLAALGLLVLGVLAFFLVNELRRLGPYWEGFGVADALWRFAAYYLATVNNAFAIADHHLLATPFYFTGQPVWELPGIRDVGVTYERITGIDAAAFYGDGFFRENAVSTGINVFGTPGAVAADFGWAGIVWLAGLGGVAGALYRTGERSVLARAVYAVWVVGLLEFLRIYYVVSTRVVPAYVLFAAALLLLGLRRRSARAPVVPDAAIADSEP